MSEQLYGGPTATDMLVASCSSSWCCPRSAPSAGASWLAPAQKAAQAGAQLEQVRETRLVELSSSSADHAARYSVRWKPEAKFSAVANVRYISQRPVPRWKNPSTRAPSDTPRLAKKSEM